jgi:hypothetical protein
MTTRALVMHWLRVIACALALFVAPPAPATVITFEGFDDSTPLTTQIPGLVFGDSTVITAAITLNEFEFPPHSGVNVIFDDGGPISVLFATSVAQVGGFFTYVTRLTFEAFDAANNLLGMVQSSFDNNEALSGDAGSSPNEFLSLAFAGIRSIRITGDPAGGSFTLDDLTFALPEPSTLLLIGAARRRRIAALAQEYDPIAECAVGSALGRRGACAGGQCGRGRRADRIARRVHRR